MLKSLGFWQGGSFSLKQEQLRRTTKIMRTQLLNLKKQPQNKKGEKKVHTHSSIAGIIYWFLSDITSFPLFIRLND